ncbi:MAG TPA: SRPBCC family protein [Polyangia bacterium]|jgi:uncharacterized membrane protein|nr:SRPBCC family protein [Polyangia bacterium]
MSDVGMQSEAEGRRGSAPSATNGHESNDEGRSSGAERAAVGLGLLSLGLGLGELVAPRALLRLIGVRPGPLRAGVLRGLGARELAVGAGLLAGKRSAPWLWARVAGDVIDLGLCVAALRASRPGRGRAVGALTALGAVTALDTVAAVVSSREEGARVVEPVRRSVTIARRRDEVYQFWRNLGNAPSFMADVESVEILDGRRSRWTARGPEGPVVSWEAVVDEDLPNEQLGWHSIEGADIRTEGMVTFSDAPGGRGTEVHLALRYGPPAGGAARAASFLWKAAAGLRLEADLRRCKQLLETGHVVHSDASAHRGPHPGRPATSPALQTGGAS